MTYLIIGLIAAAKEILEGIMNFFVYDFWDNLAIVKINYTTGLPTAELFLEKVLMGATSMPMQTIFKTIGITIVLLLLFLNLAKAFLPQEVSQNIQHPFETIARAVGAAFAVLNAYLIMAIIQTPMAKVFDYIHDLANASNAKGLSPDINALGSGRVFVDVFDVTANNYKDGVNVFSELVGSGAAALISLVIMIAITWAFIQLIAEVIERYVVMCFLFYASPMGLSAYASKSTQNIASSYFRMLFSQYLLMMLNLCFVYVFCYAISHQGDFTAENPQEKVIYYMILLAWLKLGRSLDEHMRALGLSAAQTGRGLAAEAMIAGGMAMRTLGSIAKGAQQVSKESGGIMNKISGISSARDPVGTAMAKSAAANVAAGNQVLDSLPKTTNVANEIRSDGLMGTQKATQTAAAMTGISANSIAEANVPSDFAHKGMDIKDKSGGEYNIKPLADTSYDSLNAAGINPNNDLYTTFKTKDDSGEHSWVMTPTNEMGASSTGVFASSGAGVGHDALGRELGASTEDAQNVGCFNMTSDSKFASKYNIPEGNYVAYDSNIYQQPSADSGIKVQTAEINGREISFIDREQNPGYTPQLRNYRPLESGVDKIYNTYGTDEAGPYTGLQRGNHINNTNTKRGKK